jgi:hypothetical protein
MLELSNTTRLWEKDFDLSPLVSLQPPTEVKLANVYIGERVVERLLANNPHLSTMLISAPKNGVEHTEKAIIEAITTPSALTKLYLGHTRVPGESRSRIMQALAQNTKLTTLCLTHCNIGDAGAFEVAELLARGPPLNELNLDVNSFGAAGFVAIATALATNKTLHTLHISGNVLCEIGANAMADALSFNKHLRNLHIHSASYGTTPLGKFAAIALARAIKTNSSLTTLTLPWFIQDQEVATAFASALSVNTHLTTLGFSRIIGCTELLVGVVANTSLKMMFSTQMVTLFSGTSAYKIFDQITDDNASPSMFRGLDGEEWSNIFCLASTSLVAQQIVVKLVKAILANSE